MRAWYRAEAPFIANVSLVVDFDKTVKVGEDVRHLIVRAGRRGVEDCRANGCATRSATSAATRRCSKRR